MLRLAGLLVALAACGFQVTAGTTGDDQAPSDGGVDGIAPNDCLEGVYCRRRLLSVPPAMIAGGPHVNFPLLVRIASDTDLAASARDDGHDIVFTGTDGSTRLPYERQKFVGATGELTAWVTVPQLTSAPTTELYLWYGNANAPDQQSDAAWPEAYKGVYHFDTSAADSSRFANNGNATSAFGGTGKLGGAAIFDQTSDLIALLDSASLDSVAPSGTIEMWSNPLATVTGRYQLMISTAESIPQGPSSDGYSFSLMPNGDLYFFPKVTTNNYATAATPWASGWNYTVATFELSTKSVELYINAAHLTPTFDGPATLWTDPAQVSTWYIGGNLEDSTLFFDGLLDELRITAGVRSADWISTTYRNVSMPATFITVGAVETFP